MDNRGYSQRIVEVNRSASDSLGVLLGRYCISRDISAIDMAEYFGVSKMTIYKWFTGKVEPRKHYREKITALLVSGGWTQ
jgi:hypothetical protein